MILSKLVSIAGQYAPAGSGNWANAFTTLKQNLGPTATGTTTNWNFKNRADGSYNLRLKVTDKNGNVLVYSPVVTGLIDRKAPALYGSPQPANAIYKAGTQISYSYTENINTNVRSSMVKMKDVTTNAIISTDVSAFGNTLVIVPKTSITSLTGHQFRVIADSIEDLNGNRKASPDTLLFSVGSSTPGTGPDALNITAGKTTITEDLRVSYRCSFYQGDTGIITYSDLL